MPKPTSEITDRFGHVTRFSDSSYYDEICVLCRETDSGSGLNRTCARRVAPGVDEYWVGVNYAFPKYEVQRNFAVEEPTYRFRAWSYGEQGMTWEYGDPPTDAVHAF